MLSLVILGLHFRTSGEFPFSFFSALSTTVHIGEHLSVTEENNVEGWAPVTVIVNRYT